MVERACTRTPRNSKANIAALTAIGGLVLGFAIASGSARADLTDCDWSVADAVAEQHGQTNEENEADLVRELAYKLRQFDQCLQQDSQVSRDSGEDSPTSPSSASPDGVASQADSRPSQSDIARQQSASVGARSPAGGTESGADSARAKPTVAGTSTGRQKAQRQGINNRPGQSTVTTTPGASNSATGTAAPGGTSLPGDRARTRQNVAEDDIARILREAAEKETDPTRKAALQEEYENYVNNL